jgi:hypothetical protein
VLGAGREYPTTSKVSAGRRRRKEEEGGGKNGGSCGTAGEKGKLGGNQSPRRLVEGARTRPSEPANALLKWAGCVTDRQRDISPDAICAVTVARDPGMGRPEMAEWMPLGGV